MINNSSSVAIRKLAGTNKSADPGASISAVTSVATRISLTAEEFQGLADMPPELEWFASIESKHTRRAYEADIKDFMAFAGISTSAEFRSVNRAHVLAWRRAIEARGLAGATVRRKLAALASLYEFLCDKNAVTQNPVKDVRRPKVDTYEGKTPALGDHEARALLETPNVATLKGLRDRAILSVLLFHGVVVLFVQIGALCSENLLHDKHLRFRHFRALRTFRADWCASAPVSA